MTPFDLVVWRAPNDVDTEAAAALVARWVEAGGDPTSSPFEPSTDMGWFHRELIADVPGLDVTSDAVPSGSRTPVWLSATDEAPARVVAIRLSPATADAALESVIGLAAKYDLLVFEPERNRLHRPLEQLAEYASATFWPSGAIRAASAGLIGGLIAVVAWLLSIPILSGIAIIVGAFLAVMSVYTFIHEGRKRLRTRRTDGGPRARP